VPGPVLDVKNVWTFGIGHTAAAGPPDPAGMPRSMPVDLDAGIREAFRLFRADIAAYEAEVLRAVNVPLEPHEFDALVSFHYNTGGIAKASLTRHLNAGNRAAAAQGFMGWLRPAAIRSRREAERDLFRDGRSPTGTIPVWSVDRNGRVDFSRPVLRLTEAEALAFLRPTRQPVPLPAPLPVPTQPPAIQSWWQRLTKIFTGKATS
jgi:lysozyme